MIRWYKSVPPPDTPLVTLAELESLGWDLAVLTGRNYEEIESGFTVLGFRLPAVADGAPHLRKPMPDGLLQLADAFQAEEIVFVGDTRDDARALRQAREARPDLVWTFAAVGPQRDSIARDTDLRAPSLRALMHHPERSTRMRTAEPGTRHRRDQGAGRPGPGRRAGQGLHRPGLLRPHAHAAGPARRPGAGGGGHRRPGGGRPPPGGGRGPGLGEALKAALGDKAGIARFGEAHVPLDESLARVVVDLSGRPWCRYDVKLPALILGNGFHPELAREFFIAFAQRGAFDLHATILYGENTHHQLEALFKALAVALKRALKREGEGIPSTKGTLNT